MNIDFYGETHVGTVRKKNEDSFLAIKLEDNKFLFAVADGMGGYEKGDVAGKIAIDESEKFFKTGFNSFNEEVKKLFFSINKKIINYSKENSIKKIGTTLSILYIEKDKYFIAHIGDSKIYRISKKLEQLTKDHSFVEMLLENKLITKSEALNHPKRNVLSQALGIKDEISPQIEGPFFLKDNEIFIVSSDGLTSSINEKEIEKVVKKRRKSKEITKELIKKSLKNGAPDNVTVISVLCKRKDGKNKPKIFFLIYFLFFCFLIILGFRNYIHYVNQNKEKSKIAGHYDEKKEFEIVEFLKIGNTIKFSFFNDSLYFLNRDGAFKFSLKKRSRLEGKLKDLLKRYEPVRVSFYPSFYSKKRLYILKNGRLKTFKKDDNSAILFISKDGLMFELSGKTLKIKNIYKNKSPYHIFNGVEKFFIFKGGFILKKDSYYLLSIKNGDISSPKPLFFKLKINAPPVYIAPDESESVVFYSSYAEKENKKFVFFYKNSPLRFVSLCFSYTAKFIAGVDEKGVLYFVEAKKWLVKD